MIAFYRRPFQNSRLARAWNDRDELNWRGVNMIIDPVWMIMSYRVRYPHGNHIK
jgi:hypothetical protein